MMAHKIYIEKRKIRDMKIYYGDFNARKRTISKIKKNELIIK